MSIEGIEPVPPGSHSRHTNHSAISAGWLLKLHHPKSYSKKERKILLVLHSHWIKESTIGSQPDLLGWFFSLDDVMVSSEKNGDVDGYVD